MMSDVALQDLTRVWIIVCVPLFCLSLFGMFADAVSLFFFLPLRRWGNARPPGVCVSPCVSWTRPLTSTRTSRTTSTPRSPPRLCFLLPTTSFVVPVVLGLGLCCVCWASLFFFSWRSWCVV